MFAFLCFLEQTLLPYTLRHTYTFLPFRFNKRIQCCLVRTHFTMLRRCSPKLYRYQEFEMSKNAKMPFYYPREAPNTSVFPQFQLTFWMHWGWGREELWFDKDQRRYETTWELLRRAILWFVPLFTIFPVGIPRYLAQNLYGEYGEKPFLDFSTRYPHDNMFLEYGGCSSDAEWIRHIHSKESY